MSGNSLFKTTATPEVQAAVSAGARPALLDRLEAEVQANLKEAAATQRLFQQWQGRETDGMQTAVLAELPSWSAVPRIQGAETAWLGTTAALVTGFVCWHLWFRQRARPVQPQAHDSFDAGPGTGFEDMDEPFPEQPQAARPASPAQPDPAAPQDDELQVGSAARRRPDRRFDPEAAASEVVRVRKSLAEKREARVPLAETEDALPVGPARRVKRRQVKDRADHGQVGALDFALDFDLSAQPAPAPAPDCPLPLIVLAPRPEPEPSLGVHLDYPATPAIAPTPLLAGLPAAPAAAAHCAGHDYAVTLALAEETAALELWPEARELVHEVLHAGDSGLRLQALSLLTRIEARGFAWA